MRASYGSMGSSRIQDTEIRRRVGETRRVALRLCEAAFFCLGMAVPQRKVIDRGHARLREGAA
jgi:hypothetical protein